MFKSIITLKLESLKKVCITLPVFTDILYFNCLFWGFSMYYRCEVYYRR